MPVFRHHLLTAVAVIAAVAPLAAQPPALASPRGSGLVIHRTEDFYVLDGLPRPMPPASKGPPDSPWCYYFGDVCEPWPLEQGFVTVIAPDGATPGEVERYFRRLGEPSFSLFFEEVAAVFSPDGSFEIAPAYIYARQQAHRPIEELIAAGASSGENDWIWMPSFCPAENALVVTFPNLYARTNPGYGRADLEAAVDEEEAGFVTNPSPYLPEVYHIYNDSRFGFDALPASNRLYVRPETQWVSLDFITFSPPHYEPLPDSPICPVLGPVVAPAVPALGPGGFALLTVALAVTAMVVSRRRGRRSEEARP